jgi:hypothetical protein
MPEKSLTSTPSIPVESAQWDQFELLDSGEGQKLERWGNKIFVRPEPKALWRRADPALWRGADGVCNADEVWTTAPAEQVLAWRGLKFLTRASAESKHLGLFRSRSPIGAGWRTIYPKATAC